MDRDQQSAQRLLNDIGIYRYKQSDLASDPDNMFDIVGMNAVMLLIGVVEVVVATTTTLALELATGTIAIAAATTITSDAVGTEYMHSGDFGAVLNCTLAATDVPVVGAVSLSGGPLAPFILGIPGVANTNILRHQLDGAGTGKIGWHLWYKPLHAGASIKAAD